MIRYVESERRKVLCFQLKGKYKERQLERLIRLRRVGDLPPVFPNGWYCIAESNQIKNGEIKEITVFGELFPKTSISRPSPPILLFCTQKQLQRSAAI